MTGIIASARRPTIRCTIKGTCKSVEENRTAGIMANSAGVLTTCQTAPRLPP